MTITATAQDTTARRRMAAPVGALIAAGAAWAAVAALHPGDSGPVLCPFRWATGMDCPFCGSTRAASDLARGDLVRALDHNAYVVLVLLPLAALAWWGWARSAWRGRPRPVTADRVLWALMALTAGWWILRLVVPWLGSSAS